MSLIKIVEKYNHSVMLKTYLQIWKGIQWTNYDNKGRQAGLQYRDDDDPWDSAVGRSKGDELSYDKLNPYFQGTEFENIIKKYNMKRTRLMWVEPMACYSMHQDQTPRIHVPLITNPDCYFVFKSGIVEHMPVGNIYWTDTREYHSFMNCSNRSRLHLVGIVEN